MCMWTGMWITASELWKSTVPIPRFPQSTTAFVHPQPLPKLVHRSSTGRCTVAPRAMTHGRARAVVGQISASWIWRMCRDRSPSVPACSPTFWTAYITVEWSRPPKNCPISG